MNKPSSDHSLWRRCELQTVRIKDGHFLFVGEETYEAGAGTCVFLPHVVPHSYTFEIGEVRMLAIVAPGDIEQHFWDLRFTETGRGTDAATTPNGPPDMVVLEEMAKDLASYGTEIIAYCSNFD